MVKTFPPPPPLACLQVQQGAHAIFGPSDPYLGAHVQSICDALEIPHLEVNIVFHL
jgi:ionotropic kainate glutamate receptor 2